MYRSQAECVSFRMYRILYYFTCFSHVKSARQYSADRLDSTVCRTRLIDSRTTEGLSSSGENRRVSTCGRRLLMHHKPHRCRLAFGFLPFFLPSFLPFPPLFTLVVSSVSSSCFGRRIFGHISHLVFHPSSRFSSWSVSLDCEVSRTSQHA